MSPLRHDTFWSNVSVIETDFDLLDPREVCVMLDDDRQVDIAELPLIPETEVEFA